MPVDLLLRQHENFKCFIALEWENTFYLAGNTNPGGKKHSKCLISKTHFTEMKPLRGQNWGSKKRIKLSKGSFRVFCTWNDSVKCFISERVTEMKPSSVSFLKSSLKWNPKGFDSWKVYGNLNETLKCSIFEMFTWTQM